MTTYLNINQYELTPVRGLIAFKETDSGLLSVQVAAGQATALTAGDAVKLDTTVTSGLVPQILKAGAADLAIGVIPVGLKQNTYSAGDFVEIAFFGGPIMWMQATGVAIAPQAQVEMTAACLIQLLAGNSMRGVSIDYIPANGLGRVIIGNATLIHV